MSAVAPAALQRLFTEVHAEMPKAVLSGIVGNAAHVYGYHCARRDLPSTDYSVQYAQDKRGDSANASAIDISLPPELMSLVSVRLLRAGRDDDPRLFAMREFFGTVDGQRVIGWDRHGPFDARDDTTTTSDTTHLWHVHISVYREFADDWSKLAPLVDVILGKPIVYPPTDPRWSDTVTRDEILELVKANSADATEVRSEIDDALHAVLLGGDHGAFTRKSRPKMVKDEGVLDRLTALESQP